MSLYVKLSCEALTDAKLLAAGPEGFCMWAKGLAYAKQHLTDGFVPAACLPLIGLGIADPDAVAERLVSVGLWERCEGGYCIGLEKWARWQTTKEEVEAQREAARERQSRSRAKRDAASRAGHADFTASSRVSHADVTRVSHDCHSEVTQPEPEPEPEPEPLVTPPSPQGVEVRGAKKSETLPVSVEPPWWESEPDGEPVRLVAEAVAGAVGPGSVPWYPPPDRAGCERLAERVVGIVGADGFAEAWEQLAGAWVEYHDGKRKAPYKQPLRALGEWATKREETWRRVRRQREIDADRASRGSQNGHAPPGRIGIADQVRGALALIEGGGSA